MRTLKQYLGEVWNYKGVKKPVTVNIDRITDYHAGKSKIPPEEISVAKTGHKIVKERHTVGDAAAFYALNPKTNEPDAMVYGELTGPKQNLLTVYNTAARPGSKLRASDLYHHLIKHHDMVIQSDVAQNPGSVKLWQKLARKKDVNVHAWDTRRDKPINASPNIEGDYNEIYTTMEPFHSQRIMAGKRDPISQTKRMIGSFVTLVAHKK